MQYSPILNVLTVFLLLTAITNGEDEYGLHHYSFDNDTLTASCAKPKPLIFELMFDFLTMIKSESNQRTQPCVLRDEGPGFISPPSIARNIFAATTIVYNIFARYSHHSMPTIMYEGWSRMAQAPIPVPPCVYIYGFYHIAHYLMPEQLAKQNLTQKYEANHQCNLTSVLANNRSDLGLVQMDVDHLKAYLKTDGFNQDGCYADLTNFKPVNPPCLLDNRTTIEKCRDYTHTYDTIWNYGEILKTGYIEKARRTSVPQSHVCKPFSFEKTEDYLAPAYFEAPAFENGTMMDLKQQFLLLVDIQKGLDEDDEKKKLITEYYASGPDTAGTPGHWQSITLNLIRRLCYDNEDALKVLFAVSAATYDAGIAGWRNKRIYGSVRPAIYIPTEHINETFQHQFVGMYCNFTDIEGWQWAPYLEERVITPDFQEYTSGHSTFSRAAAVVLEGYTRSPNIPGNFSLTIKAGESLFQPRCSRSQLCYKQCRVDSSLDSENNYVPKIDVTLGPWKTYREIADEASMSRQYGGMHILSGDIQGRILGEKVGKMVWAKVSALFDGVMPGSTTTTTTTTITTATIATTTTTTPQTTSGSKRLQFHIALFLITQIYCYGIKHI